MRVRIGWTGTAGWIGRIVDEQSGAGMTLAGNDRAGTRGSALIDRGNVDMSSTWEAEPLGSASFRVREPRVFASFPPGGSVDEVDDDGGVVAGAGALALLAVDPGGHHSSRQGR